VYTCQPGFVSDITYFDIGPDTYYLTFIMDLYNREIVGCSASDNLRTESTTLPALHRVINERGRANLKGALCTQMEEDSTIAMSSNRLRKSWE